jgi:MFS family permease
MSDRNHAPERVRFNFRLDLITGVIGALFFVGAFMPVVVRRMGGSEFEVALVMAAGPIGHIVSPFLVYLLHPFSTTRVLAVTGLLAKAVFLVGLFFATTPLFLALSWVAFFIIGLAGVGASTTLMQGIYPDVQRGSAMARVRICANLVGIAAALVGGALLETSDNALGLFAAAGLISLVGPAFLFFMRYDDRQQRRPMASPWRLGGIAFRDAIFRRYLVATTVLGFGNAMGATAYPLMLVDKFDASNAFVGTLAAVQSAATMVGFYFWGRRIDRGSSTALTATNAVYMIGLPLAYLLAPSLPLLLPAAIIAGLTVACADLTFHTNMIQLAPQGRAGEYMAAQSFVLGVRATVAPFVASALLVTTNVTITLLAVLFCVTLGALLLRSQPARPAARTEPIFAEAAD